VHAFGRFARVVALVVGGRVPPDVSGTFSHIGSRQSTIDSRQSVKLRCAPAFVLLGLASPAMMMQMRLLMVLLGHLAICVSGGRNGKIGPAPALSERDWDDWTAFVLKEGTCRMYVLIMLTGMFALRCGEACMLCTEDIRLDDDPPHLVVKAERGRGKSPGTVPIMQAQAELLKMWMAQGVEQVRRRKTNQHSGQKEVVDFFEFPETGRIFASRGMYKGVKTQQQHLGYHAVWAAVSKLSAMYAKQNDHHSRVWEGIRSHSGRATKITLLMGEGISLACSMRYARHAHDSIRTHLRYGRLTCSHIYKYLQAEQERQSPTAQKRKNSTEDVAVDGESKNGLEGSTLKDIIEWFRAGLLSEAEFKCAKAALPCFRGVSENCDMLLKA
jgi:integrase